MKEWIGLIARLVTGGVWIVAGALKLGEPGESVAAVKAYELLPPSVAESVGYLLPPLEVALGLCLVLGLLTRLSGALSALLFVAFIIGIASAWARGLEIDCGCFGGGGAAPDAASDYPVEIARDVGLLLLSGWLIIFSRTRFALDGLLFRTSYGAPEEEERDVDGLEPSQAQQG